MLKFIEVSCFDHLQNHLYFRATKHIEPHSERCYDSQRRSYRHGWHLWQATFRGMSCTPGQLASRIANYRSAPSGSAICSQARHPSMTLVARVNAKGDFSMADAAVLTC